MTKELLAERLNGREYRNEITDQEVKQAAGSELLVIFGASDDNVELRGAIDEELYAYDGTTIRLFGKRILVDLDEDSDDADVLKKYGVLDLVLEQQKAAAVIEAKWCATEEYSWTIETSAPHATFDILDGGEKFCRGIVIDLKELQYGQ